MLHAPGATTWTWRSCEGAQCADVVYADSLNPVSDEGFRFNDRPHLVEAFRHSIDVVERMPCDVLVSVHPDFTNASSTTSPCRTYAAQARRKLEVRISKERNAKPR